MLSSRMNNYTSKSQACRQTSLMKYTLYGSYNNRRVCADDYHNDGGQNEIFKKSFNHSESPRPSILASNPLPWVSFSKLFPCFDLGWIKEVGVRHSLCRELSKHCTLSSNTLNPSDIIAFLSPSTILSILSFTLSHHHLLCSPHFPLLCLCPAPLS